MLALKMYYSIWNMSHNSKSLAFGWMFTIFTFIAFLGATFLIYNFKKSKFCFLLLGFFK